MTSPSNRGKVAERLVKQELDKLTVRANFDYERITDAFSSRGGATISRPGDFLAFDNGTAVLLEVKEVAHAFRLPKPNFPPDQRARMNKRALAGCMCCVLVYSSVSKLWRYLPLSFFDTGTTGSWDLREEPETELRPLFEKLFYYPPNLCV